MVFIGIRAFRLRRPFQTGSFIGFFGIGSRFIAGERYMTAQVLARSTRLNSRLPGALEGEQADGASAHRVGRYRDAAHRRRCTHRARRD